MENSHKLSFAFSPHSSFGRGEEYWKKAILALEMEYPNLEVLPLEKLSDSHQSVLIASCSEVLGTESFSSPRGMIITFDGTIQEEDIDKCKKIFGKSLLGFVDASQPASLHIPWFKRILLEEKILGTGGGTGEGQVHLGKILEQSLLELQRVKKLHEKVVPLRQEKIKGMSLFSKFAAGFSSGGEFFDIKRDDRQLVILVTCAQSYVASSIILSHFENFQKRKNINKQVIEDFLEELIDECRELGLIDRDNFEAIQLDVIRLDLRTFVFEGFHFGNSRYFSNGKVILESNELPLNENSFEKAYYKGALERGEKLVFASPGVIQNFIAKEEPEVLSKIISQQFENGPKELLNEIFFQLKKQSDEDFLKFDASVLYLEVDSHAFMQV